LQRKRYGYAQAVNAVLKGTGLVREIPLIKCGKFPATEFAKLILELELPLNHRSRGVEVQSVLKDVSPVHLVAVRLFTDVDL
jgi:hypothetical protein